MQTIALRFVCALTMAASALVGPAKSGEPYWPDHLTIATASPGGTYYVYGEGLAKLLTRALDLPVSMRPTEGPAQNIELLEAGETKLAFVTTGIALQAWNASGAWTGRKPARAMRAIFPMFDTPFHVLVLQDSGIRTLAEAAGKRIGVGPHGGTTAAYVPDFLAALKIPASYAFGDWSDLAAQMHAHSLDVLAVGAGVPFPSFIELEARDKVRYIPFAPDQVAALRLALPELTPSLIAAGTYPSLIRNYQTVGLYNFAVAHAELPSDLVYRAVKAVFDNQEQLVEVHAAAAATVPANMARNTFLPLHPGAIRYYTQIGAAGLGD
jgi:TRAP transporter TAXI family solute receptor